MKPVKPTPAVPCHTNKKYPADKSIGVPPMYQAAVNWLAKAWGVPIRATSFVRDSPGHVAGFALDIAPTLPSNLPYAPREGRDPLLTNRDDIMAKLARALKYAPTGYLFFLETDHMHVAIAPASLLKKYGIQTSAVFRWAYMKESVYPEASKDWHNGRDKSPIIPEEVMNKRWPNKTGLTFANGRLTPIPDGGQLVTDLTAIHKACPPLPTLIRTPRAEKWPALAAYLSRTPERGDVYSPVTIYTSQERTFENPGMEAPLGGSSGKSPVLVYRSLEQYSGDPRPSASTRDTAKQIYLSPAKAEFGATPNENLLVATIPGGRVPLKATVRAKYGVFNFAMKIKSVRTIQNKGGFTALVKADSGYAAALMEAFKKPDAVGGWFRINVTANEIKLAMSDFAEGKATASVPVKGQNGQDTGITAILTLQ